MSDDAGKVQAEFRPEQSGKSPRFLSAHFLLKASGESSPWQPPVRGGSEFLSLHRRHRSRRFIVPGSPRGIGIVVGGGNIFRGLAAAARGMDRARDYIGMLATS